MRRKTAAWPSFIFVGSLPSAVPAGFYETEANQEMKNRDFWRAIMSDFVHLHVHSQYSLLDGAASLDRLVEEAVNQQMPALAVTDHGVMYGCVKFFQKAKAAGIKPIIGCEVYVAPRSRNDRVPKVDDSPSHLVLLAADEKGYRNLVELVSRAHLEGFYYKPRVDHDLLAGLGEGLIALSACLSGEIPALLSAGRDAEALEAVHFYQEVYGRDNFYIELQDQRLDGQLQLNRQLVALARQTGAPLAATNDVHYLRREDAFVHDVLLCIQTGSSMSDPRRFRFPNDEFYMKTYAEMNERFRDLPEALSNTVRVAEQCQFTMTLGQPRLPAFDPPEGVSREVYLRNLCETSLETKYHPVTDEVKKRLDYELGVIGQMGFPGYFLTVWDFVKYARENGIMVGPGRGSAAGSIVSYLLGITELDPIQHGLFFERFLNPERVTMPDIDIDFCYERRGEVIDYVRRRYGEDHVAQIIAFGTMAARGAVRDVGRAMGLTFAEVDAVAKRIPQELGISLDHALKDGPDLAAMYEKDENVRRLLDIARQVEGFPRHASTHAAGVVIAPESLTRLVPLQRSTEDEITTQLAMDDIETLGLLKIDFLGLRTLTVLQDAQRQVESSKGLRVSLADLPLDDRATFDLLREARTLGVFQLESSGMRRLMASLAPERFEDLVPLVALYRPGPLGSGMVEDFIRGRHGEREVTYMHPALEPVLRETYGVILYQEQVMQISHALAGFSLAEADILRRAMGKKKPKELARMKEKFMSGSAAQGVETAVAEQVFALMEYFSGYGFNKSHSAAYALLAYQTAYFKANHPLEYMCALISSVMGATAKVAQYIDECRAMSIPVLPPDVNHSRAGFGIEAQGIRFGLLAVKNVGRQAIDAIVAEREKNGNYASLYDFCRRVPASIVNKRVVESLIKAGGFTSTGRNRREMLFVLDRAFEQGGSRGPSSQLSLFDVQSASSPLAASETWQPAEEFPGPELLRMEREYVGVYLSGHPLEQWRPAFERVQALPLDELGEMPEGQDVLAGGLVNRVKVMTTRSGRRMAVLTIEDVTGMVEVTVFPDLFQRLGQMPAVDQVVLVRGRLERREEETKILASQLRNLTVSVPTTP